MPVVELWTNLSTDKAAKLDNNFRKTFIALLADTLGKPQNGVALIIHSAPELCQLGPDGEKSTMIITVKAIGHLGPEENIVHAKRITEFIIGTFEGILEASRVLIHFQNLEKFEVAKNGTTVQALLEAP